MEVARLWPVLSRVRKKLSDICGLNLMAEKGGFEPPVRFDPYTRFPSVPFQPLTHLSAVKEESGY